MKIVRNYSTKLLFLIYFNNNEIVKYFDIFYLIAFIVMSIINLLLRVGSPKCDFSEENGNKTSNNC